MPNEMTGDHNNVVQAGTINGGVTLQHNCTAHLAAFLQAADSLSSPLVPIQLAALSVLTRLAVDHKEMVDPVYRLLWSWGEERTPMQPSMLTRGVDPSVESVRQRMMDWLGVEITRYRSGAAGHSAIVARTR